MGRYCATGVTVWSRDQYALTYPERHACELLLELNARSALHSKPEHENFTCIESRTVREGGRYLATRIECRKRRGGARFRRALVSPRFASD